MGIGDARSGLIALLANWRSDVVLIQFPSGTLRFPAALFALEASDVISSGPWQQPFSS